MNHWFFLPLFFAAAWLTYHFRYSSFLPTEKVHIVSQKQHLPANVSYEREGISRTVLQNHGTYHIDAPFSRLEFREGQILERLQHFQVRSAEGCFQGENGLYDFKKQMLVANNVHLNMEEK